MYKIAKFISPGIKIEPFHLRKRTTVAIIREVHCNLRYLHFKSYN